MEDVPYRVVNAHIINNGAMALHEARAQETVKPYAPILPGLIDVAIGIYEATGAAKTILPERSSEPPKSAEPMDGLIWRLSPLKNQLNYGKCLSPPRAARAIKII